MKPKIVYSRCHNCGIKMRCMLKFFITELTDNYKKILTQWTQQQLSQDASICEACFTCLNNCETDDNPPRAVGHEDVCAWCGNSVLKKRFRAYSAEEYSILRIPGCDQYKHLKTGQYMMCHACQFKIYKFRKISEVLLETNADTQTSEPQENVALNYSQLKHQQAYNTQVSKTNTDTKTSDPQDKALKFSQLKHQQAYKTQVSKTSEPQENVALNYSLYSKRVYFTQEAQFEDDYLILPEFKKFPGTKGKCVIPKCQQKVPHLSRAKRKLLFLQTNTLLDRRCSLCTHHQEFKNWPKVGTHNFTKLAVEDAISMCEKPVETIDFDRINEMPDHLCKYWTGLTADEFKDLYMKLNVDTSQFHSLRNALAVYLLRQKTGDSLLKLANLFLMTACTLSRQLMIIEKCFKTYDSTLQEQRIGTD